MPDSPAFRDSATLADFVRLLRQRLGLILLLLALVLITTAAVTALLPKWYLATTKVRVEKPEGTVQLASNPLGAASDPTFLPDQFRIMQSEKILYPVIDQLDLNARIAASLGSAQPLTSALTFRYLLDKMVRIDSQRNSSLIEISVYAQDPVLAAEIANHIARVYSEDRIALATSDQREGLAQLRRQLELQQEVVRKQRDALERLRKDLNISGVDLNARYSDMEIETLRQMQNSLIALSVDAIGRRTRYERFKAIPPEDRMTLANSELIPDQNIQSLLQAYLLADQKLAQLRARLGAAHPDLVSAVENRAKIKEQLDALLRGYESGLEISAKEAEARVAELKGQLAQAKVDQILSARDRMRPFEEAAQRLENETRVATTLELTLRQREIDFQVPKKTIEILNTAEPARRPSRPSWPLNLALAFVFGSALAVGVALLLEHFDTSFRTVADVEERLQLPVLGVIPAQPRGPAGQFEDDEDPAVVEPYRVLQTNLNLARPARASHALAVFSAGPGEGKSTTLWRLARLMGAAGDRVVLIDSDLRRPTQHHLAHRPKGPGLGELLLGSANLDTAIQRGIAPGLDFIPCGMAPGLTLGLAQAPRLRELLAELRTRYDQVVFDSPPVIGVSDASVLASAVDGALLVIQHRRNPQSMILRAQQILTGLKTPVVGVVLNQVPTHSGEDYGYYTANYAYYRREPHASKGERGAGRSRGKRAASSPDRLVLDPPKPPSSAAS